MPLSRPLRVLAVAALARGLAACGGDGATPPSIGDGPQLACTPTFSAGAGTPFTATPAAATLPVLGAGVVADRWTSELWVRPPYAYTSSWGRRGTQVGDAVRVWDVANPAAPRETSTLLVSSAATTGDVQLSDDGRLLVVATEPATGSVAIYDAANPARPTLITQYSSPSTAPGVHTADVSRVNGTLYAFLSIDPSASVGAKLVILDLSNPAAPREVFAQGMGNPYVHDVFVRDGVLFTALWDDGVAIWDLGGLGCGGSPAQPVRVSRTQTVGGQVHNIHWLHDAAGGRRFVFVGQEGPGSALAQTSGDIHVVDATDPTAPREVAFFTVPGAGTHNFSVDETRGVLYAAYYNGGVRALDVRGDLGSCTAAQKSSDGRCNLGLAGRELARGLADGSHSVWGVHVVGDVLYASDMPNGLITLRAVVR